MEILIKATELVTVIDGVPVRAWSGTTQDGTECVVLVHRIAVAAESDTAAFERELTEQLPPAGEPLPLSIVLGRLL